MPNNKSACPVSTRLQLAMQAHQRGELAQAEQRYKDILSMDAMHPDAHHNVGILSLQTGQLAHALHHFEMALLCNSEHQQFSISYLNLLLHANEKAAAHEWLLSSCLQASHLSDVTLFSASVHAKKAAGDAPFFTLSEFFPLGDASKVAGISASLYQQLQAKRINYLHQAGDYAELEEVCRFILARNQDAEDAWIALGAALFEQNKPALEVCQQAVLRFPNNSAAHGNLGAAQTRAGLAGDAISSAQHAIDLNPDHAQAHYNLANCFKAEARYEEAIHHYRLALASRDDLYSAHHNLGLCLKATGQFEEAQHVLREVLKKLFARLARLQTQSLPQPRSEQASPRQPIHQEAARQVLATLCQQFAHNKIPCCLFAGTLLGIYRNGDILPYDKDLDLAIPAHIHRQQVIAAIAQLAQFQVILSFGTEEEQRWHDSMSLFHAESGLSVDLFFLHEETQEHFLVGAFHPLQSIYCRLPRFTLTPYEWRGQTWLIPSDPERYLEAVYGKQWRTPDTQFDTVISNPSRIEAAIPVVLCYAYSHLFHAINTANWKRACHLIPQLLALKSDAMLSELGTWIETHHQLSANHKDE